jgi:membrane protein DedA with SNARE-associated domain
LLPVVRTFISLPAGITRMSPARFGIYTLAGCILWTTALAWAGYAVGANWQHVASAFHGASYAFAAVIVLLVVVAFAALMRRRIRERSGPRDLASDHEGR